MPPKCCYCDHFCEIGHILSEKQFPICLRLHDKTFVSQKFPRGRAPQSLYSIIILLANFKPLLTEKLDPPLDFIPCNAELFLYKPWRPKGFFQFEIGIKVFPIYLDTVNRDYFATLVFTYFLSLY